MSTNVSLAEIKGKKKIVVRAKLESKWERVECICPNCGNTLKPAMTYVVKKCSYCHLPIEWLIEEWKPQTYREGGFGRTGGGR